ncbi:MAG: flagellar hook-basal body protein [Janthinobacterium lividum]
MNESSLLALRALQQDQATLARVGFNLANAATPGFKRQGGANATFATFATFATNLAFAPAFAALIDGGAGPGRIPTSAAGRAGMPGASTGAFLAEGMTHQTVQTSQASEASQANRSIRSSHIGQQLELQTLSMPGTYTDFRPGSLTFSGRTLDLALTGAGFFEIQSAGTSLYTRQGNFSLDARSRLVTAQGDAVMGKSGEIMLENDAVTIDANGNIFDATERGNAAALALSAGPNTGAGAAASTARPLAQLKIVQFEQPQALHRAGAGLLASADAALVVDDGKIDLRQGHLENSNVDSLQEMLSMMTAMRHAESMVRISQAMDDMLGNAIRKLGKTS